MSGPRLMREKGGARIVVWKCIDCPKLPACGPGWCNDNVASGPIPQDCRLMPIKHKTARKIERELETVA